MLLAACSSSIKTVATFVNKDQLKPEPYKSVFIIALTGNLEVKTALENNLAAAAEGKGIKVYKSISVIGPFSGKESIPSKDIISKRVKELGCEAIFAVALLDKETTTIYRPPSTTVYAGGYTGYPGYNYYGTFGSYYSYAAVVYDPGYYKTDKTYFVESNLYDAKTELLVMSIQSKAVNPPEIDKSGKEYTESLVEEIAKLKAAKK